MADSTYTYTSPYSGEEIDRAIQVALELPAVSVDDNGKALCAVDGTWQLLPAKIPTGTLAISDNGIYDVSGYQSASVSVSGGGGTTDLFYSWDEETLTLTVTEVSR